MFAEYRDLGQIDYKACWEYQQRLFDTLLRAKGTPAEGAGYLLLVEHPAVYTLGKSGLMVGLGESDEEVLQTLRDLHAAGVEIVTLGQYLRPTLEHHPVAAYITPEKFDWYRQQALDMGFSYCASGPMVRSSYLADEALGSVRLKRQVSAKA